MKNCTCDKLDCDDTCLCACHREDAIDEAEYKVEACQELVELNNGLDRINDAVDLCIERMQKYDLKLIRKEEIK